MFADLLWIALVNPGFWIIMVVSFGYPIYKKITSPLLYSWKEFGMQFSGGFIALIIVYTIFFQQTTDIANEETINTSVTSSEYYEPWTQRATRTVCTGSKHRSCRTETYYIHHPAEYKINGANGYALHVGYDVFSRYQNTFGSKKEHVFRSNQSSFGDGNKYVSIPNAPIPMAYKQGYIDYIKASQGTILKDRYKRQYSEYENKIAPYPDIENSYFGPIDAKRIVSGVKITGDDLAIIEKQLDQLNMINGDRSQSNIIVYLTLEPSQRFVQAVLNKWSAPRQNDIIVFVSIDKTKKIRWVQVKAFTKHELFKKELESEIYKQNSFSPALIGSIAKQMEKPTNGEDGFLREKMENYEYLRGSISLAWYWNFLIFAVFMASHFAMARFFERNDRFN